MKHKYEVVVGNVGTMDYTNKKLAKECFATYVTLSKDGATQAAYEPITLLKDGEIIEEYTPDEILYTTTEAFEAIKARINGEWDNIQLMKIGEIGVTLSDIQRIIESTID